MDYQFDQSKEDIKNKNIYKINCSITDKRIQEKLNCFINKNKDKIANVPAEANHFELTSKEENKGKAVKILLRHLNLGKMK